MPGGVCNGRLTPLHCLVGNTATGDFRMNATNLEPVQHHSLLKYAPSKRYFCSLNINISIDDDMSLILEKQQFSAYMQHTCINAWEITTGLKNNNSVFFFKTTFVFWGFFRSK